MKKLLFLLIATVTFTFASNAQGGVYLQAGTSLSQDSKWSQELEVGGYGGNHSAGLVVETIDLDKGLFDATRTWYGGIKYAYNKPVGETVHFIVSGEGKVNLTGGSSRDLVFEPGIGLGFSIVPSVQLQLGIGAKLPQLTDYKPEGQANFGLNFKF